MSYLRHARASPHETDRALRFQRRCLQFLDRIEDDAKLRIVRSRQGYSDKFSLGLITTGGSLGLLLPLSLPILVYSLVAGIDFNKAFSNVTIEPHIREARAKAAAKHETPPRSVGPRVRAARSPESPPLHRGR